MEKDFSLGTPAVSTWGLGTWDLFALSDHHTLLHKWDNPGGWQPLTGWEDLGGSIDSAPAALTLTYTP